MKPVIQRQWGGGGGEGRLKISLTGQPRETECDSLYNEVRVIMIFELWSILVPGETQTETETGDTCGGHWAVRERRGELGLDML